MDWLHVVIDAPTWALVSEIYREIFDICSIAGFYVHPLSDFNVARVGLVFPLSGALSESEQQLVMSIATRYGIDLSITANAPTLAQPGLLVMDMDSTVIACECIDEIAKLAGVGEAVSEVTERAMRGELDFAESLRSRVACLKGLPVETLQQIKHRLPIMPGLVRLLNVLQQKGWRTAIASGGFTYFADHLRQRFGLDDAVANVLALEGNTLNGEVEGRIVDANVKAETVSSLAQKWQISPQQTVAMGDGANDLVMMNTAKLGVAFKAKPIVQQQADTNIQWGGLDTALMYLRY